jgi:plasmid maintenance system antidote protein VapI
MPTTWTWKITIRKDDTMPMKNPVHPGALAKANLAELNLSVAEAAKAMKITRQQLYKLWLRMQAAYDLAQARKQHGEIDIPRLVEHPSL